MLGCAPAPGAFYKVRLMTDIRSAMPMMARSEGVWEGVYRYYDSQGTKVDEHASRLVCRIPASGPWDYHQTNHYTWADGRKDVRDFLATFRDGRIWFDNDLIKGWAAADPLDPFGRTMLLYWVRKNEPALYLYEMIQVDDACRQRSRVWQWIRDGRVHMRTLIDEVKVADDWVGL